MRRAKQNPFISTYLPASTLCDKENTGHVNTTHTPHMYNNRVTARGADHIKAMYINVGFDRVVPLHQSAVTPPTGNYSILLSHTTGHWEN